MNTITTRDGVSSFFKDWGGGPPLVFSHGWPLSADDWDARHCARSPRARSLEPNRYADSAPLSASLVKHGTLKTYKRFPHGMPISGPRRSTRTCWRSSDPETGQ
jgi:pimeloyl-ACP methyl ester carboxylesterase